MKLVPLAVLGLLIAALLPAAASSAPDHDSNKVDVCHVEGNGSYHLINVSTSALPAHLAHGDGIPGTAGFDENCSPVIVGNDYASRVIVANAPRATGDTPKTRGFVVKVSNLGTGPFTVTPADIAASVEVNGIPSGSVSFVSSTEVVPGKRVKFRFNWTYTNVAIGDSVEFLGCVNAAGDANSSNDCDSVTTLATS